MRLKLSACALLFFLSACVPVPTVMGRPAAVPGKGRSYASVGGGLVLYDWPQGSVPESLGLSEDYRPYYHLSWTYGLSDNFEMRAGVNNAQILAELRMQIAGESESERSSYYAPDIAIECGFSIWPYIGDNISTVFSDAHIGASISLAREFITPYAAVRMHIVGPDFPYGDTTFDMPVYYFGAEIDTRVGGRERAVVEMFYSKNYSEPGAPDNIWGANVILRGFRW